MMFKALKFWKDVSTVYTSKTPRQDFPLLAIHMTILQIFSLAYPVGELMRLSQTTSTVFVVPCVFLVVKLFTTTLRLDQPMQLYDPARGDFDDADFPLEFGMPQATVTASSPLKQGDVLLEQGVADTRALLARAMEERFLHNYAYKSRADERSWWCVLFSHPPQIQVYECTSLRFLLVLSRFLSCVYLLCSVHSFSPKKNEIYHIIL
jgi:hypothetical protein